VRKSLFKLLGFVAGLALSATVFALGMGGINVTSNLGQPLKAEIELVAVAKSEKSSLVAKIASPEIYKGAGLEYPYGNQFKFEVATRPNGEPYLKVTSVQPVNDPFVVMLVEMTWASGRLMREYTFLLDPPGYVPEMPAQTQVQPVVPAIQTATVSAPAVEAPVAEPSTASQESAAVTSEPVSVPPAVPAPEVAAAPQPEPAAETIPAPAEAAQSSEAVASAEAPPAPTEAERSISAAPTAEVEAAPVSESAPAEQARPAFAIEQVPAEQEPASTQEPAVKEAATAEVAEPNKEWVSIQRGDTLGKVSQQYKPADVSLERMLVALYRANANEFDDKNMNRIRAGKILRLPSQEEIDSVEQTDAVKEIRAQTADWNAYRQRLAGAASVPATAEEASRVATGKIESSVADKAPVAKETAKEVLKLSKGEAPGDKATTATSGKSVSAEDKKNSAQEEAIAKAKAEADEKARAAILENNLKDMQRLAKLKSAAAALSQQPGASSVAAASEVKPAQVVAPKPAPAPATAPVEPSLVDQIIETVTSEPLYLAGGAGLLLLLGALAYLARKRKGTTPAKKPAKKKAAEDTASQVVRIASPGAASAESGDFTSMFAQQADTSEQFDEADPISEADLFLNFGRDAQAEEILKEALQATPNNHKIHLKLMEIYAKRKDLNSFGEMARQVIDSGDEQASQQAIAMGREIDPDNSLFGGTGASVASKGQTDVQDVFAATPEKPTSVDFDVGEPSEVLGISPEADFLSDAAKAVANADQQRSPEDDFLSDATGTEVLSFESAQAAAGALADGQRKSEVADGENTGALPQLDESTLDAVRNKFSLPVTGVKPGKPAPKDEDDSLMEFTLDLPADDTATQAQPAKTADLAGISLDLGNVPQAKSATLSDEHIQEVATKLDLAKAYQEMGDASGAREILEEVLREGDESQREAANALLAQL